MDYTNNDNIDTDVDNYTLAELLIILDLDNPDQEEIIQKTNEYIDKFDNEGNDEMALFFANMQEKLLQYSSEIENTDDPADIPSAADQQKNWWENEYLKQTNNPVQNDKITERKQKIQVFDNPYMPMNRDQLGVNNNYTVPVAQDVLNPNLENITSRFINLDSQFRQATGGIEFSSSDYTLDLSEPLHNVLSLRLYSIQIPYAWYTIDTAYGNTCFWLVFNNNMSVNIAISVEPGNYSASEFVQQLNMGYDGSSNFNQSSSFTFPSAVSATYPVNYNANNGKIYMNLYGGTCTINGETYSIDETTTILFYDVNGELNCGSSYCNQTNVINQTLGWIMGYRMPYIYVEPSGNYAPVLLDLYGPKYLILAIDDFNQNHINNGLVTITELSTTLKLPTYYNPGIPTTCPTPCFSIASSDLSANVNNLTNLTSLIDPQLNLGNSSSQGLLLAEKLNLSYKQTPQVLPTAPRTLTQAQIYSINEIMKNNEKNTNYRSKAPTSSDTFALIPLKIGSYSTGNVYVEFGGSLQDNKRIYFGPVNIERMRVKLMDDKGNTINMNGADWSVTLISENLYQY
jgi:hypothetical protein